MSIYFNNNNIIIYKNDV